MLTNSDRRSYRKIITPECKALRSLRRIKKISQDNASSLCGYSRSIIGHIENGRIELSESRIRFIVSCYGSTYEEFQELLNNDRPRDILQDECIEKIKSLSTEKLELINNLLKVSVEVVNNNTLFFISFNISIQTNHVFLSNL